MKEIYQWVAVVFAFGALGMSVYILVKDLLNLESWKDVLPITSVVASLVYMASLVLSPVAKWNNISFFKLFFRSSGLFIVNFVIVYAVGTTIAMIIKQHRENKRIEVEEKEREREEQLMRYCEENNIELYM